MSPSFIWMIVLLAIWALLLFGAYLRPATGEPRHRSRPMLLGSSAVLTVAAWSTVLATRSLGIAAFPLLIATGMTFGFLGDLFMGRVLRAPNRMIAGMGSFGIGHVFYVAAGILMYRLGFSDAAAFFGAWAVWLLIAFLAWYFILYRGQRATTLLKIALPYSLLLASTAGAGTGLALSASAFLTFALGGALFLASDFLIALREFSKRRENWILDGIWLTYGPAQALIVYTAWLALR